MITTENQNQITEDLARDMAHCPGCGKPKTKGLTVCWDCFKYRQDVLPLKYFGGTFSEWLLLVAKKSN